MIDKNNYRQVLAKIANVLKKYEFFQPNLREVEAIKAQIDEYVFRIILIGGFSSGKSALLNRLVGRSLFRENQGPETAVPAEISWAPSDSAAIVYDDGSTQAADIATVTDNPPANCAFIAITADVPFLKERPGLVLVDFPGFDSNIDAHNKAIGSYLQKGSAFILLVPAKSGGLTESDKKFVREASNYPQNLACLISKSDLVTGQQCEDIKAYTQSGIVDIYGTDINLESISVLPTEDQYFENKVGVVIDNFNPQLIFEIYFKPAINNIALAAIKILHDFCNASTMNLDEIDIKIASCVEIKKQIEDEFKREYAELDRKYREVLFPQIMTKLERTLTWNVDSLAASAMDGEKQFNDTIQNLVRPVLANIQGNITESLRNAVECMNFNFTASAPEGEDALKKTLLNIVDVISSLPIFGGPVPKNSPGPIVQLPGLPPAVTMGIGAGLVGLLANPVTGLLVGLAALALKNFSGSRQEIERAKTLQAVKTKIQKDVIPQLLERLEDAIMPAMHKTKEDMLFELQKRINANIEAQTKAIEAAKKEKQEKTDAREKEIAIAMNDVETLKSLVI